MLREVQASRVSLWSGSVLIIEAFLGQNIMVP